VNPLDWGILGAGLLVFIFSFISYYTVSAGGFSDSTSAWHGFFGWFGTLLALAGAVVVGLLLFAPQVKLPWPSYLVALALFALATLSTFIALFTNAYDTDGASAFGIKVDSGHGFGYWASLILCIAGTVMALMRLQQTGGKLPGALGNLPDIGSRGPRGNQPPTG
jgi:MFS superfamily sulfate permease-like transporter